MIGARYPVIGACKLVVSENSLALASLKRQLGKESTFPYERVVAECFLHVPQRMDLDAVDSLDQTISDAFVAKIYRVGEDAIYDDYSLIRYSLSSIDELVGVDERNRGILSPVAPPGFEKRARQLLKNHAADNKVRLALILARWWY